MAANIVQTSQNVTLVGAGQASKGDFDVALNFAPYLVAADGGAKLVLNYGNVPKKVIGDFDSANRAVLAQIPPDRQHRISDQDSTDFEKCLRNIQAPLILGVGFLGARLDHQLAVMNALVRHGGPPCILFGGRDLVFHLRGDISLPLEPGTRISIFPMAETGARSKGLRWPLDGLTLAPNAQIGVSNEVATSPAWLSPKGPGLLVILPKRYLAMVIETLNAP